MIPALVLTLLTACHAAYNYKELKVDGQMREIAATKMDLFGINDQDQIMTCKLPCDGSTNKWTSIPGKAAHISANEQEIWIALADYSIKRCLRPCTDGKWEAVPGLLRILTVNNDMLWGVNMNGDVFKTPAVPKKPVAWENMAPGVKFRWVTVGLDGEVWGAHDNGQVVRFDPASSSWKQSPANAKRISVGEKQVYAINNEDRLFHCERPCDKAEWSEVGVPGQVKDVAAEASGDKFYGLKGDNSVFEGDFTKGSAPPSSASKPTSQQAAAQTSATSAPAKQTSSPASSSSQQQLPSTTPPTATAQQPPATTLHQCTNSMAAGATPAPQGAAAPHSDMNQAPNKPTASGSSQPRIVSCSPVYA